MTLGHDELRALAAMGPSAHHLDARVLAGRVAQLPQSVRVGASLAIETFRPRRPGPASA